MNTLPRAPHDGPWKSPSRDIDFTTSPLTISPLTPHAPTRWLDFAWGDLGIAEIAGLRFWLAGVRLQTLLRKANFNPGQLRDEVGRWTSDGGSGRAEPAQGRRRSGSGLGTPVPIER